MAFWAFVGSAGDPGAALIGGIATSVTDACFD